MLLLMLVLVMMVQVMMVMVLIESRMKIKETNSKEGTVIGRFHIVKRESTNVIVISKRKIKIIIFMSLVLLSIAFCIIHYSFIQENNNNSNKNNNNNNNNNSNRNSEERIKKLNRMWDRYGERPKIYTYFDYVEAMREEEHLLELWAESWWYYGWRPVVLDRSMAERHLEFQKWNQTFSRYPSINRKEYEMACYHRWIAMAVVGDGFLSDMDVINYGFKPPSQIPSNFTLYQGFIPALASASKQEYERIVNELASIDVNSSTILLDGRPHLSDMYIFKKLLNKNPPSILSNCSLFSGEKLLEHWSHNVAGEGLNRAKIIPHIRKHPAWSYREGPTYTEEIKELLKQKNLL
jgi:hypothetical protein